MSDLVQRFVLGLRVCLAGLMGNGGSFAQRIGRGSAWVFISYGGQQLLSLIRSVILARLLSPADFGLMGLASLSTAALLVFTETGIWPTIIQRKELDQDLLDTAWSISAIRGLLLALIIVVLAPWISLFFGSLVLVDILRVLAVTFSLSGLNSLGLVLLQRNLEFKRLAFFNISIRFINLCFSATAGLLLRNFWALIIGELAGSVGALVFSYAIHDFRPGFRFVRSKARQLLNFGKYVMADGVLTYLRTQGDDAYVGKVLGTEALGFYGVAYRLSNLPATSISHVLRQVTFPAFSAVQEDLPRLRGMYLRTLRLTALISVPFAGGLFILAPYIVTVLYGNKWMPAVPAFMILCFFGLERSIGSISASVLLALGKPQLLFQIGLVKLAAMGLCIVPLTGRYGFLGTSIAVTISAVVVQCVVVPVTANLLKISILDILVSLVKPMSGTLLMMGVILALRWAGNWPVSWRSLLVMAIVGGLVYTVSVLPTEWRFLSRCKTSVLKRDISQNPIPCATRDIRTEH